MQQLGIVIEKVLRNPPVNFQQPNIPMPSDSFEYTCDNCLGKFTSPEFIDLDHRTCPQCHAIQSREKITAFYNQSVRSLPEILRNVTDRYDEEPVAEKMIGASLFIYGPPGAGKSVFSSMILKARWRRGLPGIFVSYPQFIFRCQSNYDNAKFEIKHMMTAKMLVLDDFGQEKYSEFVHQTSYLIIDSRLSNQLQTVITSNKSLDDISTLIDPAIASRIFALCKIENRSKYPDRRLNKNDV